MITLPPRADAFEQALERACEKLEALALMLAKEQSTLIDDGPPEPPGIRAARLEALAREKERCLADLSAVLAQSPGRPQGSGDTPRLRELARRARAASTLAQRTNRVNGRILATQAHVNAARLELLANAAGRPRTYGADGRLNVYRGVALGTSA